MKKKLLCLMVLFSLFTWEMRASNLSADLLKAVARPLPRLMGQCIEATLITCIALGAVGGFGCGVAVYYCFTEKRNDKKSKRKIEKQRLEDQRFEMMRLLKKRSLKEES